MRFDDFFDHEMDYPPAVVPEEVEGKDRVSGDEGVVVERRDGCSRGESEQAAEVTRIARLFPGGGGVYLLTDEFDRLIQLSAAGDLRRALRVRLLEPEAVEEGGATTAARRRAKLGEIVRKIRWRSARSMFEVDYEYLRIARVLLPADYLQNLAFGPAWFVHVDPEAEIPRFVVGKRLRGSPGVDVGPFATQGDAGQLVQMLQDGFDLCRYCQILEQVPQGQPCAYFEMGKCPGPCAGLIPMSTYRGMVHKALGFVTDNRHAVYAEVEDGMALASADRAYEKAASLKQRLERLKGIDHAAYRYVRPVEAFNYLILQRGHGRTWVKPFFVRGGRISPGDEVRLKAVEEAAERWVKEMAEGVACVRQDDDRAYLGEQIWLVSHYLFKRDARGLFVHASDLGNGEALAERVRACFGPQNGAEGEK